MEAKPLILIVEDEEAIGNFISAVLTSNQYRVLRARTGREARMMVSSHAPDAVLLDLGLPDVDGVEVLREMRQWTNLPVVVVSARGHEHEKVEALDLGADDYIVKPFGTSELLARVRTALRHSLASSGAAAGADRAVVGELEIDYLKRAVTMSGQRVHLTPIEYRILALLSKNAGKVLTHDFIIREVWGAYTDESHALRVNMANIRRKLEVNPGAPQYILTEVGVGYRMVESL